ncbi:MAG TPA: hypothetical protein VMH90_03980, partial [Thermoplasmata archaeon]|nr:hypothetical protein [Thermoplasmata archaeon]
LLLPLPPISWSASGPSEEAPPLEDAGPGIWLRFGLPRGSYATVLLREFQKTGAVPLEEGNRRPG